MVCVALICIAAAAVIIGDGMMLLLLLLVLLPLVLLPLVVLPLVVAMVLLYRSYHTVLDRAFQDSLGESQGRYVIVVAHAEVMSTNMSTVL